MAETPEDAVQETNAPSTDLPSPRATPNGKIASSEAPQTDADGDVNMEQATHVNGHAGVADTELGTHDSFPAYRSPSHFASPRPENADVDDDARPPPAKRARKFSDADQASLANVSLFSIFLLL